MSAWCLGVQRHALALMALHGLESALASESHLSLPLDAGAAMTLLDARSGGWHSLVRAPAGGSSRMVRAAAICHRAWRMIAWPTRGLGR